MEVPWDREFTRDEFLTLVYIYIYIYPFPFGYRRGDLSSLQIVIKKQGSNRPIGGKFEKKRKKKKRLVTWRGNFIARRKKVERYTVGGCTIRSSWMP